MKKLLLLLLFVPFFGLGQERGCVSGDCENGDGTYVYSGVLEGGKYVGEWKDGNKNGKGTYTYASGSKYVGEWKDGKRNGEGINYWILSSKVHNMPAGSKYEGQWLNGLKDGYGKTTYADGTIKEGLWKEGDFIK